MRRLRTQNGKYTLLDDSDYEALKSYKWRAYERHGNHYVVRTEKVNGKPKTMPMHRQIMDFPTGFIDHRNGNALDNTRKNLRVCTQVENQRNRKLNKNSRSGYKGVCWSSLLSKWTVYVGHNKKQIYLGSYKDPKEAAKIYDNKAKELYGEFARTNF